MDLNQLYYDHQIALMRASAARNRSVRSVHQDHAAKIAVRIESSLRARGAGAARLWEMPHRSKDQPGCSWRVQSVRRLP